MRILLPVLFLIVFQPVQSQVITKVDFVDLADTVIFKNNVYAIYLIDMDEHIIRFQSELGGTIKTAPRSSVQIVSDNRAAREYVDLYREMMIGKQMFISVVPYKITTTKIWSAIVDSGMDSKTGKLEVNGRRLNFKSELAVINYLIAKGWNVYQIDEIDISDLMISNSGFGSGGVDSVKISNTRYIMTKFIK